MEDLSSVNLLRTTADIAGGGAFLGGITSAVEQNATVISISIAFASLIASIVFHYLNWRINRQR